MPFQKLSSLIHAAVDWIPLVVGRKIRSLVYRPTFEALGHSVQIETGVQFTRPQRVSLGSRSRIRTNTVLEVRDNKGEIQLGENVVLDLGTVIKSHSGQGCIRLGAGTYIGPYTCLSGRDIEIGRDCMIASHSGIYSNNHGFERTDIPMSQQPYTYKPIVIGDDCWLGTGVKVLAGVTIGKGSIIGAGSVVSKDIPPYSIAVGVPAKVIKSRTGSRETPTVSTAGTQP